MEIKQLYTIFEAHPQVSTDTRKDPAGKIFFCLKGENFNANEFAREALSKGAVHVVSDDKRHLGIDGISVVRDVLTTLQQLAFYHRSKWKFPVIGITGSNGKTTNKELITAVLQKKYRTYATAGNLNNHIGVPLTLLSIPLNAEMAVIEMGANHQGEIRELSAISDPEYGMITNIGKAHLEGFGGLEGVKKGKKELYDHIRNKKGKLFVNADDSTLMEISEGITRVLFGTGDDVITRGHMVHAMPFISVAYQHGDYRSPEIRTKLVGGYNFANIMAAVCIGCYFGVEPQDINAALSEYNPGNNRSQLLETAKNKVVMDAYNANPSSMESALRNFAEMDHQPKIAMLGQMLELGETSHIEHQTIVNLLRTLKLSGVLVGRNFENCEREGFQYFPSTKELSEWLALNPIVDHLVLLKGSRMVAMEKALEKL
jgi:UDP-N-acetylmuramoyl-tripeptide--D-alanyl-D-alanine ligase